MNHPYLQPLGAGEIVVATLRLYRDHVRLLVMIALWPHLALLGLESLVMSAGRPSEAGFLIVLMGTVVANGTALAAITVAVGRVALGPEPGVGETYRLAFASGLVAVLLAYLATALLVSLGIMLLVVPGVLLGALFAPTIPMIVVERRSAMEALVRSVTLMKDQLAKGIIVFAYFMLVAGFLPLLLLVAQGSYAMGPFTPLLSALVGSITLPLGFTANVLLYFSLRAGDAAAAEQLAADLKPPPVE